MPTLGDLPVSQVTAREVMKLLREIEARSPDLAHRVQRRIAGILDTAESLELIDRNPAAKLGKQLGAVMHGRNPAVTDISRLREIMQAMDDADGYGIVKLALRFCWLTAVRMGTVNFLPWSEIPADLDGPNLQWVIPASRMKLTKTRKASATYDHVVPLSPEAVAILKVMRAHTGKGALVFPSPFRDRSKGLSENAVAQALRRVGFSGEQNCHGGRASFSSIMNERRPRDSVVIDLCLGHVRGDVEGRYNRSTLLEIRRDVLTEWAGLLCEGARPPADVMAQRARAGIGEDGQLRQGRRRRILAASDPASVAQAQPAGGRGRAAKG